MNEAKNEESTAGDSRCELRSVDILLEQLLPCPFCASKNLRIDIMYWDDDGEGPGIECIDCDAIARPKNWNNRWIDGRKTQPDDGQILLAYHLIENPEKSGLKKFHIKYGDIVICGPVVRTYRKKFVDDGIHRKVAFWQPIDALPEATDNDWHFMCAAGCSDED